MSKQYEARVRPTTGNMGGNGWKIDIIGIDPDGRETDYGSYFTGTREDAILKAKQGIRVVREAHDHMSQHPFVIKEADL